MPRSLMHIALVTLLAVVFSGCASVTGGLRSAVEPTREPTHDAVVASARATSSRLGVDPSADSWLAILPVAHIGGLSVILRALVTDTPVVFEGPATLVSLVPTQANRMDLSPFRWVVVGGSSDWRDRWRNCQSPTATPVADSTAGGSS